MKSLFGALLLVLYTGMVAMVNVNTYYRNDGGVDLL